MRCGLNFVTHNHAKPAHIRQERALKGAFLLTLIFCFVELFGGVLTKSLALISDAAHMFTDVTALAISYAAIKISQKKADHLRTFGYYRFEILAAVVNAILLFGVAFYIAFEAYRRMSAPAHIQSTMMLVIAFLGLIVNLLSMRLLHREQHDSMNLKSAYLEVWSDALGSIGVIISALLIQWLQWYWADSLIAILIAVWILPRTWNLLKASIHILLEGVPERIDLHQLQQALLQTEGVIEIHELHVWAINHDKISLTAHVVIEKAYNAEQMIALLNEMLFKEYAILHTTLQLEYLHCEQSLKCHFNEGR